METQPTEIKMKMAMYYYECSKWWGKSKGIRNITFNENDNITQLSKRDAQIYSKSHNCDINLLHYFNVTMTSEHTFPPIEKLPINQDSAKKNKFTLTENLTSF